MCKVLIPFWNVFNSFTKMHWFAAPRLCFTTPKPCLTYFCKKRDPLVSVQSKRTFARPFCERLLSRLAWPRL